MFLLSVVREYVLTSYSLSIQLQDTAKKKVRTLPTCFFFRFVDAVLDTTIRTRFLHLPTQQQQLQNRQECYAKYKLPNILGGIDGCHKLMDAICIY